MKHDEPRSSQNFTKDDYVVVASNDFASGGKLLLRWRGSRSIIMAINDYVYQKEDLPNGELEDVYTTRLKIYHDKSLIAEAILPHVVTSETGKVVPRLAKLVDDDGTLMGQVRWRDLSDSKVTLYSCPNL